MKILLDATAYNSLTQRVHVELDELGHEISVELALKAIPNYVVLIFGMN
jgi:putative two-component system protein, hydrogenase maturation factor HypX/HoxX